MQLGMRARCCSAAGSRLDEKDDGPGDERVGELADKAWRDESAELHGSCRLYRQESFQREMVRSDRTRWKKRYRVKSMVTF